MKKYSDIPYKEDCKYLDYLHKLKDKEAEKIEKLKQEILKRNKES